MLIAEIARWKRKYPDAVVFLTGDFNSAPGQFAHRTLLGEPGYFELPKFAHEADNVETFTSEELSTLLFDTWETCQKRSEEHVRNDKEQDRCDIGTDTALTFNGWLPGTYVDSYLARIFGRFAFTLHGMQFKLPLGPPNNRRELAGAVRDLLSSVPQYSISESVPKYWTRVHVDWILHDQRLATPEMFHVADVRDEKLSSDHFPVIGVFKI